MKTSSTYQSPKELAPIPEPGIDTEVFVPHRPTFLDKTEGGKPFRLVTDFTPSGDQPNAISELCSGLENSSLKDQVLLGVTGSGKTFTMAHIIAKTQRPALILAPNKTLAAQLYTEFKGFFPDNAVEYFVSYYDYYQPEAYVPRTDTYIEKDSNINEQIDRMRHATTRSLLERDDVIIVASVSCIYGLGSVESYSEMKFDIKKNMEIPRAEILTKLIELQYERNDIAFGRGSFRVRGDIIEIFPSHCEDRAWRIDSFGDEINRLIEFDPITSEIIGDLEYIRLYANSHYVTPMPTLKQAIEKIKIELQSRLQDLNAAGHILAAQRLEQRTHFDIEMIESTGSCAGIENYSRYLTGRDAGMPPPTLYEYLPQNALLFCDESHVSVPQIGAMFKGDFKRKSTLAQFGFRLPSCVDNRPLKFEEWNRMRPQSIHVSATPSDWELKQTQGVFTEQVIRPTGLIDPICEIRPALSQIDDLIIECKIIAEKQQRILVTTLTKKMAEDLTEYMQEQNLRVRYMHSDVDTLERIEIIRDLRLGLFDILIGINLLREGLDIPECALVAILDADREGFLRSETALIQTIGRAARHIEGRAFLYADKITNSIKNALAETNRRRKIQKEYNIKYSITPQSIKKNITDSIHETTQQQYTMQETQTEFKNKPETIEELTYQMHKAAENLEFEIAAKLRDKIVKKQHFNKH